MRCRQIFRSFSRKKSIGETPTIRSHGHHFNNFGAIVAAAALAHDIGSPPFGYSEERVIGNYLKFGNGKRFKFKLLDVVYQDLFKFEENANEGNHLTGFICIGIAKGTSSEEAVQSKVAELSLADQYHGK